MIQFLNTRETSNFLKKDKDRYLQNLSYSDLYARLNQITYIQRYQNSEVQTPLYQQLYKDIAISASRDFTQEQTIVITKVVDLIHQQLQYIVNGNLTDLRKKLNQEDLIFIFISKLLITCKQTWKFALFTPNYENGLPHTRKDIIFIPTTIFKQSIITIITTIIHERVHILQRYLINGGNKHLLDLILFKLGFVYLNQLPNIIQMNLLRSNPDIDNNLYIDVKTAQLTVNLYDDINPRCIQDLAKLAKDQQLVDLVTNKQLYQDLSTISFFSIKIKRPFVNKLQDHPFEQMAYKYSNFFVYYIQI